MEFKHEELKLIKDFPKKTQSIKLITVTYAGNKEYYDEYFFSSEENLNTWLDSHYLGCDTFIHSIFEIFEYVIDYDKYNSNL